MKGKKIQNCTAKRAFCTGEMKNTKSLIYKDLTPVLHRCTRENILI
jgi:hypothetical protein